MKEGVVARTEYDNADCPAESRPRRKSARSKPPSQRKTIRAPFSGVLGIRQVNLGQYLAAGQAIVSLQALNPIYVNFGVPQQRAPQVHVGQHVCSHQ